MRESDADDYINNGHKCWVVPDSAQGNVSELEIIYWTMPQKKDCVDG